MAIGIFRKGDGRVGFAEVVGVLAPVQQTLGREVNATVMKPVEFARRREEGDGFVAALMREPKIWLMGGEDDLG